MGQLDPTQPVTCLTRNPIDPFKNDLWPVLTRDSIDPTRTRPDPPVLPCLLFTRMSTNNWIILLTYGFTKLKYFQSLIDTRAINFYQSLFSQTFSYIYIYK